MLGYWLDIYKQTCEHLAVAYSFKVSHEEEQVMPQNTKEEDHGGSRVNSEARKKK